MVSFNVFGGVSVQVVEDELVGVHCSHQRVCRLQETEEVVELKALALYLVLMCILALIVPRILSYEGDSMIKPLATCAQLTKALSEVNTTIS